MAKFVIGRTCYGPKNLVTIERACVVKHDVNGSCQLDHSKRMPIFYAMGKLFQSCDIRTEVAIFELLRYTDAHI